MTTPDVLRARLSAAGKQLAAADEARARALEKVTQALKNADGELTVAEMARLAGVTRPTVYALLKGPLAGGGK